MIYTFSSCELAQPHFFIMNTMDITLRITTNLMWSLIATTAICISPRTEILRLPGITTIFVLRIFTSSNHLHLESFIPCMPKLFPSGIQQPVLLKICKRGSSTSSLCFGLNKITGYGIEIFFLLNWTSLMPYLRQEFDKVLDLSKKYECTDATRKIKSKVTSLIFNIPVQHPKGKRYKRRSFLFQGRRTLNFASFSWRDWQQSF